MYGERVALAVIAVNATNALNIVSRRSCRMSQELKLIAPWILTLFYVLPMLIMPDFAGFEYDPDVGECTISSREIVIAQEVVGTYLPFLAMVSSYCQVHRMVCTRQRYISDNDNFSR